MMAHSDTTADLAPFRAVQKLAYRCAVEVADSLQAGVTEKQAAKLLDRRLRANGVREYFHEPFAWFGDRTAFTGFRTVFDFFPTHRRLEVGMPAILDVAPIVDRYPADIGYSFRLGDNALHAQQQRHLQEARHLILAQVLAGHTLQQVYRAVTEWAADHGYESCHKKYPFAVLAHRMDRLPAAPMSALTLFGFGVPTIATLLGRQVCSLLPVMGGPTPLWNGEDACDVRPGPGLWAVEPHLGRNGVGAKWEEMLVVTESTAFWLDDDLPHVALSE